MLSPTRRGDRVRFRASDVFLTSPDEAFLDRSNSEELHGTVIGFSDSGSKVNVFALVEVADRRTVVVPVKALQIEADSDARNKEGIE